MTDNSSEAPKKRRLTIGARGHTVPNLVRQRRRFVRIIKRNGILIRAQAAFIQELKGRATMNDRSPVTPTEFAFRQVLAMKQECEAIQQELVERDFALADAQARLKDLHMEVIRRDAALTRQPQ